MTQCVSVYYCDVQLFVLLCHCLFLLQAWNLQRWNFI